MLRPGRTFAVKVLPPGDVVRDTGDVRTSSDIQITVPVQICGTDSVNAWEMSNGMAEPVPGCVKILPPLDSTPTRRKQVPVTIEVHVDDLHRMGVTI